MDASQLPQAASLAAAAAVAVAVAVVAAVVLVVAAAAEDLFAVVVQPLLLGNATGGA